MHDGPSERRGEEEQSPHVRVSEINLVDQLWKTAKIGEFLKICTTAPLRGEVERKSSRHPIISAAGNLGHCCTLPLCYLGAETDETDETEIQISITKIIFSLSAAGSLHSRNTQILKTPKTKG